MRVNRGRWPRERHPTRTVQDTESRRAASADKRVEWQLLRYNRVRLLAEPAPLFVQSVTAMLAAEHLL